MFEHGQFSCHIRVLRITNVSISPNIIINPKNYKLITMTLQLSPSGTHPHIHKPPKMCIVSLARVLFSSTRYSKPEMNSQEHMQHNTETENPPTDPNTTENPQPNRWTKLNANYLSHISNTKCTKYFKLYNNYVNFTR